MHSRDHADSDYISRGSRTGVEHKGYIAECLYSYTDTRLYIWGYIFPHIYREIWALYIYAYICIYIYNMQGCIEAPDLFLNPMDWLLERTVHRGMVGTSVGSESFSDLDFADDVALLAEMLSLLVLAHKIWMKKRDHSASPSTGQRPRFRQCLTPHPWATRLQLMVTVWK